MFHVKHDGWTGAASSLGIELTGLQVRQLERYEGLLRERALPLGMIAHADADRLWERHLLDSLRAATVIDPEDATAYDFGSGAGLPGIVLAVACPGLEVRLVESRRPRGAFLELVAEELSLPNARVLVQRVGSLSEPADLCLSRAFRDVRKAWADAEYLLVRGGRLVYFAGEGFDPASAPEGVPVDIRAFPSLARSGPLVIMTRQ
jgi:16S rRNA (guanine527-N7)-methyltransferase